MCEETVPESKHLLETPDFLHMLLTLVTWFLTPDKSQGKENSLDVSFLEVSRWSDKAFNSFRYVAQSGIDGLP